VTPPSLDPPRFADTLAAALDAGDVACVQLRLKEVADDALRLGCSAIGFTIYPGSDAAYDMMHQIQEMALEAKAHGIAVVVWSYPRGGSLSKAGETAMDICAYAAHMAALMGAHIIKVKPPTNALELDAAKKVYESQKIDISTPSKRIAHVVQSCFNGRRIVVFSGGEAKDIDGVVNEARAIRDGGGNGSIIGRNTFQRPRDKALALLEKIIQIYQGQDGTAQSAKSELVEAWQVTPTMRSLPSAARASR
jgi:class I fructose-bisphosphate aldolase